MEVDRQILRIEVSEVRIGERTRDLSESKVDELVSSILVSGLMNPIWVSCIRDENGRPAAYRLISGNHRLAAAKKLDWEFIDARIVECDEIEARLMEITENLHRSDLTPEEASLQRAEYARLTAVRRGDIAPDESVRNLPTLSPGRGNKGGIAQAARETGVSRRQLQRDIAIASLTEEQRASARPASGRPASQAALLRVANPPAPRAVPTPLDHLCKWWGMASEDERQRFLEHAVPERRAAA
jgi:ParB/RepB/Spo0J family partition protein